MSTQTIDYKRVKCPKCGKSHFRVKDSSGFTTLSFIFKPEPIYKDGELQNPTEAEPIKVRCECLECKCNFRVEAHDVFGEYRFIDEDAERKENERKLAEGFKVLNRKTEKNIADELLICDIKVAENTMPYTTDTSQNILDRLNILETKVNQLMEKDK